MIETLITLIPVALFIALRMIEGRKREAAQRSQRNLTSYEEEEPEPNSRVMEDGGEELLSPERIPMPEEEPGIMPEPALIQEASPEPERGLRRFSRLSPVKQGMVWAEIFGSPRAYRQ